MLWLMYEDRATMEFSLLMATPSPHPSRPEATASAEDPPRTKGRSSLHQPKVTGSESNTPETASRKKRKRERSELFISPQDKFTTSPPGRLPSLITNHPVWATGNFEVVTSDNVRFRVPDYVLFAARWVARQSCLGCLGVC